MQVVIQRLPEPYDECIDTSTAEHDFKRNVYEELYPETLYSLEVSTITDRIQINKYANKRIN